MVVLLILAVLALSLPPSVHGKSTDTLNVFVTFTPECPLCRAFLPRLGTLAAEWQGHPVRLTIVVPDIQPDTSAVRKALRAAALLDVTVNFDSLQEITKGYGLTVTPEAVVVTESGAMMYRGRIDNLYERLGVRRRVVSSFDLRDVVRRLLEGGHGPFQTTTAVGCVIERR